MKSLLSILAPAAAAGALLLAPADAHATVSCFDLHGFFAIPSGGVHAVSLATSAIGLGVSDARRGWYNAAIATVATNYAQSAAMVVSDAAVDECGDRVSTVNLAVEGAALAATTALLVTVLIVEPRDADDDGAGAASAPMLTASMAPGDGGALAVFGGSF